MSDRKPIPNRVTKLSDYLRASGEDPTDFLFALLQGEAPRPVRIGSTIYLLDDDILLRRARLNRQAAKNSADIIANIVDGGAHHAA